MPPKKLRPSKWRSLEGDGFGTAVVFAAAVLVDVGIDVGAWVVVLGGIGAGVGFSVVGVGVVV